MTPSSRFSLQPLPKAYPLAESHRRLVADSAALPLVVNGIEIEFELSCSGHTVLATSYDYFDGCSHWIYLLQQDGKPIDQISMPDQSGFLQDVAVVSPTTIAFGFYGSNDRWNLVVHTPGFWSFAPRTLFSRPVGLWFSRRRLALQHTKGSAWSRPANTDASSRRNTLMPDQSTSIAPRPETPSQ